MVTIMAFGIPGDTVTAVMLGALTITASVGRCSFRRTRRSPAACSPPTSGAR
jgi:hypothetical protein